MTFEAKNGSTQSANFPLADATKTLASVNKICQKRNGVVLVEDGSYSPQFDVYVKGLIDTGGSDFAELGERR